MRKSIIVKNKVSIAVLNGDKVVISDLQSALDLLGILFFDDNCSRVVLNKSAITPDFFDLKTQLAGEILQKFGAFAMRLAIVGDFSEYTSESFRAFVYECNHGNHVFFVATEDEAVTRLSEVL